MKKFIVKIYTPAIVIQTISEGGNIFDVLRGVEIHCKSHGITNVWKVEVIEYEPHR